jgi:hypothetical protein
MAVPLLAPLLHRHVENGVRTRPIRSPGWPLR